MGIQYLLPAGDGPTYNNCFTLGSKKIPVFIDHDIDDIQNLYGSKSGSKRKYYELSYEEAVIEYYYFRGSENWERHGKDLRIGLWLDNAMFDNLHIFVIDFDDSIIEDKGAERQQDRQDVSMGVMRHEEYRAKWYGETVEQAKKNLPEQNQVMEQDAG